MVEAIGLPMYIHKKRTFLIIVIKRKNVSYIISHMSLKNVSLFVR